MEASGSIEAGQPAEETPPDVGARLKSAREAQALSLDEVSAELRISAPALAALEENRFEALGAPVFAKGYLKQYGARLGLAVDELAAAYERTAGGASVQVAPSQTIRLRDERQITLWIVSGLLLALLVVLLALWWLRQPAPENLPESAVTEAVPEPAATEAATEPAVTETAPEPLATEPAPEPGATQPELDAAELAADSDFAAAATPPADEPAAAAPLSGPEAGAAGPEATVAPAAAFSSPSLEVVFVEDSWTEITSAGGERLFYALGEAGTRQRFPADPDLNLLFGNAGGVELRIDGRPVAIPGSPQSGDVAQFTLATLID